MMHKKISSLLLIAFFTGIVAAQNYDAYKYMYQIDSTVMRNSIATLASDAFEGRGTGQAGGKKTQEYIAQQLKDIGITSGGENSTYFQYIGDEEIIDGLIVRNKTERVDQYAHFKSANIIGIIEGSGNLKDEYIVLGAHHDHDGIINKKIYNGADDNASGVAAILEIGRILTKAKQEGKGARRSILLILFGAEELGLIGSKYYVQNPLIPLEATKACVNLDMLGRKSSYYNALNENNYLIVTQDEKLSGDLLSRINRLNRNVLNIDLKDEHFKSTDHYYFTEEGVPALSFFSGIHQDYHTPNDVANRIDMEGMLGRVRLAFLLAWDLANAEHISPINQ